jgi:hypothetical protein
VQAHDENGLKAGNIKTVNNYKVDLLAGQATLGDCTSWVSSRSYADAVLIVDAGQQPILDVSQSITTSRWNARRMKAAERRSWFLKLYPENMVFDWQTSCYLFQRPVVSGGVFIYKAPADVLKWIIRVRSGALATQARLNKSALVASDICKCCNSAAEDDEHVLTQCSATGAINWALLLSSAWTSSQTDSFAPVLPPQAWFLLHRLPLLAALIPVSLFNQLHSAPMSACLAFAKKFHLALASRVAELLQ